MFTRHRHKGRYLRGTLGEFLGHLLLKEIRREAMLQKSTRTAMVLPGTVYVRHSLLHAKRCVYVNEGKPGPAARFASGPTCVVTVFDVLHRDFDGKM